MDLSIIIPTFDEARKIRRDVTAAAEFLAAHMGRGEIIVSDDGSRDGTLEAARAVHVPAGIAFRVLGPAPHRGKGAAVRSGIGASTCEYVMFADSGLTTPFENALRGLDLIGSGRCELAHGSRKLPESVIRIPQQSDRKVSSALFRALLRALFPVPRHLTDTQCGFKVYRGDVARRLYGECVIDGFLFDVEVILRAQHHGCRILEFPIEWSCDRDSRLTFRRSSWPILQELLALKRVVSSWPPAKPKR
jgi:dolichyl-phosphate beta-glucosyltransferase